MRLLCDFDSTISTYPGESLPIQLMIDKIKRWIQLGYEVVIFTARGDFPQDIQFVKNWLRAQGLPNLEVTSKKDYSTTAIFDDRACGVIPNEGITHVDVIKGLLFVLNEFEQGNLPHCLILADIKNLAQKVLDNWQI